MDNKRIVGLINDIKSGKLDVDSALKEINKLPFEELDFAKVDHHRAVRNGFPEVIFCQGKTEHQIASIFKSISEHSDRILATRAWPDAFEAVKELCPLAQWHEAARIISLTDSDYPHFKGKIVILTAGTADIPVAEEAAVTAKVMGHTVDTIYDVGVAGIHRLLAYQDRIAEAAVIIVVAGMEGALASVVAGLVDVPVVGVPTSVGYGVSLHGLSALMTMLNSCAKGIGVVNIDNGFGAAALANTIIRSGLKVHSQEELS